MSHWKGFKIKNVSKYTYHTTTLRWLQISVAHGHWVSMTTWQMHRRKYRCTALEASIQQWNGKWVAWPQWGENDNKGSSDWQERHREGLPLGTDLLCLPRYYFEPFDLSEQVSRDGLPCQMWCQVLVDGEPTVELWGPTVRHSQRLHYCWDSPG